MSVSEKSVLAQEPDGQQESVSGNAVGIVEGDTESEDGTETELAEETNPEGEEPGAGTGQEKQQPNERKRRSRKPSAEMDIKADDMSQMTYAAMSVGDDEAISCSLDGGTTWNKCDAIENVLFNVSGYTSCDNPIIRLNKDITVDGDGAISLLINNNNVLIDGQGHTITRATKKSYLFDVGQAGTLTFRNVTIDGGAVWDKAENVKVRTNSGFSTGGNAWLIYSHNTDAKVILDNGAILQNNHLDKREA